MKTRNRRPAKKATTARNPLKYDPTRTVSLRRSFASKVRARFAKLAAAVTALVEREDAFGLSPRTPFRGVSNVFCPTGPGGGIDPTCSPGGSTGGRYSAEELKEWMKGAHRSMKDEDGNPKSFYHGGREDYAELRSGEYGAAGPGIYLDTGGGRKAESFASRSGGGYVLEVYANLKNPLRVPFSETVNAKEWAERARAEGHDGLVIAGVGELVVFDPKNVRIVSSRRVTANVTANDRFAFRTDPEKLQEFLEWLKSQLGSTVAGKTDEQLWQAYIEQGFRKGAARAFDDAGGAVEGALTRDAAREQFLRSAFYHPVSADRLKLLVSRTFDELRNTTSEMSNRMARTLADGLVRGASPREVARDLRKAVDIGAARAELIARTELIRAHAEGQLVGLERLGVTELGVQVEWSATGDGKVCPKCRDLDGRTFSLAEARGKLPRHPACRCSWIPAVGGDLVKNRYTPSRPPRRTAPPTSNFSAVPAPRPPEPPPLYDPWSVPPSLGLLSAALTMAGNVFCPTGEGGGVDPTCSPGEVKDSKKLGTGFGTGRPVRADPGDWTVPDWQHAPTPRSQNRYLNRHTGKVFYGEPPPRGRTEQQRKADSEVRDRLLSQPAAISIWLDSDKAAAASALKDAGLSPSDMVGLTGRQNGSLVRLTKSYGSTYNLSVTHPDTTSWERVVSVEADGGLSIYNQSFFVRPSAAGGGWGTKVFADQVRGAVEVGVDKIKTTAGRGMIDGQPMNGYYTWPRLGYDAPLDQSQLKRLPPELRDSKTVLDLYRTEEGRRWWRDNGTTMSMSFDVSPGSRSMAVLNAYLESKGERPVEYTAEQYARNQAKKAGRVAAKVEATLRPIHDRWTRRANDAGLDTAALRKAAEAARSRVRRAGSMSDSDVLDAAYQLATYEAARDRFRRRWEERADDAGRHWRRQAEGSGLDWDRVRAEAARVGERDYDILYEPNTAHAVNDAYGTALQRLLNPTHFTAAG